MAKFSQEIINLSLQSGIDPEHLYNYFNRPESLPFDILKKIQKLYGLTQFVKNEIAAAQSSKHLPVFSLFGKITEYIGAFLRYGQQNVIIPMPWETPRTIIKKYYCHCFFICEDDIDLESLIDLDAHFIFLNPPRTQNIFDEIRSKNTDECVHVALKLLSFHNSLNPFKVIIH